MIVALAVICGAAGQQAQAAVITVNPGPVGTEFRSLDVDVMNAVIAEVGNAGLTGGQTQTLDFMFTNPVSVGRLAVFDWSLWIDYDAAATGAPRPAVSLLDSTGAVIRRAFFTGSAVDAGNLIYRGPFAGLSSGDDQFIFSGVRFSITAPDDPGLTSINGVRLRSKNTSPDPSVNPLTGPFTVVSADPAVIPVPAAAPLFLAGLAAVGFVNRRRKKRAA